MSRAHYGKALLCAVAALAGGCGGSDSKVGTSPGPPAESKVLNLYIWSDYMAPDTISEFEKSTGIKVHVSYFDNNETLESRMLTGHSGFDVVVPTASLFLRQIKSGAYLPLDKSRLSHLANLDKELMAKAALTDPGNSYGLVYTWGTFGIGYNEAKVAAALPHTALDSWRVIFDREFAAKLSTCGIDIIDDPAGVTRLVLEYLGRNPQAPSSQDIADVEAALMRVRPFIRNIDTAGDIETLANGDVCVLLAYNGDVVQARRRAREADNGQKIDYVIPQEGSLLWLDMLAIPKDAPDTANAYRFLDYLLEPRVIAQISNAIGFANANTAAAPFIDPAVLADVAVYPTREQRQRLFLQQDVPPEQTRAITRLWQRFKTGQ